MRSNSPSSMHRGKIPDQHSVNANRERVRRRRWTTEEKRAIAEESAHANASLESIAKKYGISRSMLHIWRQHFLMEPIRKAPEENEIRFVPISVMTPGGELPESSFQHQAKAVPRQTPPPPFNAVPDGRIEILLSGSITIRVDAAVDEQALRRVLSALEQS